MVLLELFAPYAVDKAIIRLEQFINSNSNLRPESRKILMSFLPILRHTITLLHRCHLAWFYLSGIYYSIAKRITGVNYVSFCTCQVNRAYYSFYCLYFMKGNLLTSQKLKFFACTQLSILCISYATSNIQGSHWSWKSWKVLEFEK